MQKSIKIAFAIVVSTIIMALSGQDAAAGKGYYPVVDWTYRIKPQISGNVFSLSDGMIAVASDDNSLHFIDAATGSALWVYSFGSAPAVYNLGSGRYAVFSGSHLHILDLAMKRRVATYRLADPVFSLHYSAVLKRISVTYPDGNIVMLSTQYEREPFKNEKPDSRFIPVGKASKPLYPDIHGAMTLRFSGEAVSAWAPGAATATWRFEPEYSLTGAWAGIDDTHIALLGAEGDMPVIDTRTGEVSNLSDLAELIDMRFWDDPPEMLDNYATADMVASSPREILITGFSNISKIRFEQFPREISLQGKARRSGDTTAAWAMQKAITEWDNKRYPEAIRGLREIVSIWPQDAVARLFLGMAYSSTGNYESAVFELRNGLEINPGNIDIRTNLAGNYLQLLNQAPPESRVETALKTYHLLITLQPHVEGYYRALAEIMISSDKSEDAARTLEAYFHNGFPDVHTFSLLLAAYYLSDKRDKLENTLNQMDAYYPDNSITDYYRVKIYSKSGRYGKAVKAYAKASKVPLQDVIGKYGVAGYIASGSGFFYGSALMLYGRYSEGIEVLDKFVVGLPSSSEIAAAGGWDKLTMDKAASISKIYGGKSVMLLKTESSYRPYAMMSIAQGYMYLGNSAEAVKYLKMALEESSSDMESRDIKAFSGYIMCSLGVDIETASGYVTDAYTSHPQDAAYMRNMAVCLAANGKREQSEEMFLKALSTGIPVELLNYEYGKFLLAAGRAGKAAEYFRKELDISPDMQVVRAAYAKAVAKSQKPENSRKAAKKKRTK